MGLYDFVKRTIQNRKRILDKDLDLNAEENKDLLEDPELLSNLLKGNIRLKNIKVPPDLSEEHKKVLRKKAEKKDYTYRTEKFAEYMVGYDKIVEIDTKVTDFSQYEKAEEMYEEILKGLNQEWSDLSKFKYLYNQLAMSISYDYSATNKYNDEIESIYKADNNATNVFSSILTQKGICLGIAEAYEYLCKKANLECEIEEDIQLKHAYNIITYNNEGEKEQSYCDLTWDLSRVKQGKPCEYFALSSNEFIKTHPNVKLKDLDGIDKSRQTDIDKEIGYIPETGEYKINIYIDSMKKLNKISDSEEKINAALNKMVELGDLECMSDLEVITFAKMLLNNLDIPEIGTSALFIRNKEDIKDTKGVLWVKDIQQEKESYNYYVFNENQQQFKSLDKEVIGELLAAGMLEFYSNTKLPGFEGWDTEKNMQRKMREKGLDR